MLGFLAAAPALCCSVPTHRTLATEEMEASNSLVRLQHSRVYSCTCCQTHVATHDQLISKSFQGRHGRAFLFAAACVAAGRAALEPPMPPRPYPLCGGERAARPRVRLQSAWRTLPRRVPCRRVNVQLGPKEDRVLMTGLHTVSDIFCASCAARLGWKYEEAFEASQKYKEGKFIVEKAMMFEGAPL